MALILATMLAAAQPVAEEPPELVGPPAAEEHTEAQGEPPAQLVPPRPLSELVLAWPPEAPPRPEEVVVVARLRVDERGEVQEVALLQGGGEPFDGALLVALTHLVFEPARYGGEPVTVDITYTHRFTAPPPPPERVTNARLAGLVVEKGTRLPVAGASVTFASGGEEFRGETDAHGAFALAVLGGSGTLEIYATGYKRFLVSEAVAPGEEAQARYLVERLSYNPYETVVTAKADRVEVARTSLRDREIHNVPGTFGDPFRVVGTLPGVGTIFSLLGYPVVRGTSPGNTGFLLDGIRVPQLYHLLAGPSVLHPDFIDRVDFYPGVFPVQYGGYTGGIVDGITRRALPSEERFDFSVDLTNVGLLYRTPVEALGGTVTAAGRYGYPGLLLKLFQSDGFASYWDYQLRFDKPGEDRHTTMFFFGAFDEVGERRDFGPDETLARSMFHRVTLRHRRGTEARHVVMDMTVGLDQVLSSDDASTDSNGETTFTAWTLLPRLAAFRRLTPALELRAGVDLSTRFSRGDSSVADSEVSFSSNAQSLGFWLDLPWTPTTGLVVTPGARADLYRNENILQTGVDPRLLVRKRLAEREVGDTWLELGAGVFHQPPRFPVPIPGLDELALERGLLRSLQGSAGVEHQLTAMLLIDAQVYYAHMDPIYLDLAAANESDEDDDLEDLLPRRVGRSYGLELMLRHRDSGDLFGWISYTLSRTERREDGSWHRFDFDRPHMLHVVTGVKLPRSWEVSGRVQVQSGRPIYVPGSSTFTRLDPFLRFDLRIDKRAVYDAWLLDFYVDVINVTLAPEEFDQSTSALRYVLPTLGFRAVL